MPLNLRFEFAGRPVKPVALGLLVAMAALVLTGFGGTGLLGGTVWGTVVAVSAAGSAVALMFGWVCRSQPLAEAALAAAFFTMCARTAFLFATTGASQPAPWLSLSLAVIAGGSFWLERVDGNGLGGRGR